MVLRRGHFNLTENQIRTKAIKCVLVVYFYSLFRLILEPVTNSAHHPVGPIVSALTLARLVSLRSSSMARLDGTHETTPQKIRSCEWEVVRVNGAKDVSLDG